MRLTNKLGLPDTFVNVIKRPQYTKGDSQISVTEMMNSPQIVQLKRKHWDELEEDAADMVWSLFGSAVHNILQHGKDDNHIVEQRIFTEFGGWRLSGAVDLQEVYDDGIVVSDYKVTGAWAVMNQKADWHNQLNVYAWLIERETKRKVKGLQIIAIVRDWNRRDTVKEGYPPAPVTTIPIPLWSYEEREKYVKTRLSLHGDALFGDAPACTSDDMWERPESFAVMKEDGKRAKSVHPTREQAEAALPPKGYFIEHRPGDRVRCEQFCQVRDFCKQYASYTSGKGV